MSKDSEQPCMYRLMLSKGSEVQGGHILLCTIQGCLDGLERQIRDLIAANAAEYQRGIADGFREGRAGVPAVPGVPA